MIFALSFITGNPFFLLKPELNEYNIFFVCYISYQFFSQFPLTLCSCHEGVSAKFYAPHCIKYEICCARQTGQDPSWELKLSSRGWLVGVKVGVLGKLEGLPLEQDEQQHRRAARTVITRRLLYMCPGDNVRATTSPCYPLTPIISPSPWTSCHPFKPELLLIYGNFNSH